MPKVAKYARTASELAEIFDVSRRTITDWQSDGFPRKKHGRFILKECWEWVGQNKTKDGDDNTKAGLEKQKLREIIRKLIRENEVDEGKYLLTEDVARGVETITRRIRAVFLRFPKTIGATLGIEVEKKAHSVVEDVLKELENQPLV